MKKVSSVVKAKKFLLIPLIIIIVLFVFRFILLRDPSGELDYTVKQEDLVDTVQVSGTYTTASQTPVNSPTNGTISQLFVSNGDVVKKGDPLFHVESTATTDQQRAAYANYTNALNSLQTAQNNKQNLDAVMWSKQQSYISAQNTQNYKNNHTQNPSTKDNYTDLEKLQIDNAVVQTQKDFSAAQQAYKTADAAVSAAQAEVSQTLQSYQETQSTTVTAPADGTVVNLLANIDDQVTAPSPTPSNGATNLSTPLPHPVLVIANLNNPYLTADISEDYAVRIMPGQKAKIVFDAVPNQEFSGTVDRIDTVGTNTQGIITYSARITAPDLPISVKPDMTALITIETLRKNAVIDVPNSAIITKNGQQYVQDAGTHKLIPVTTGTKGTAKTEIVSDLSAGTIIVANPD